MVVGDLRRGLKGTIVMGGCRCWGTSGPPFFVCPFGERSKRFLFIFSLARENEPKECATPKAPLTSLTFVTTRPNEQDSMALAAPKVDRGMQTENCRNRQFSVGFGKPGRRLVLFNRLAHRKLILY